MHPRPSESYAGVPLMLAKSTHFDTLFDTHADLMRLA